MIGRTSRYAGLAQLSYVTPDGRQVVYFERRFIPPADRASTTTISPPASSTRLDLIAAAVIGDPEQFWRICDANDALDPFDLLAEAGTELRVPQTPRTPG